MVTESAIKVEHTQMESASNERPLEGMSAALIVDSNRITAWQYDALLYAVNRGLHVKVVLHSTGGVPQRSLRNWAYYLLRLLQWPRDWEKPVAWAPLVDAPPVVLTFEPERDGRWERLPAEALAAIEGAQVDVVIKFGMGLLRDPEQTPAPLGVLSFHHGDPAQYRGRPAGFYEVLQKADHMGVMVQQLTNSLDRGRIFSLASVQVTNHSYRHTLRNAYGNAAYLLHKALRNAQEGKTLDHSTGGPLYRLPDTATVARLTAAMAWRKARRLLYGAFWEKRWTLGYADQAKCVADGETLTVIRTIDIPHSYRFLADPVPLDSDTLLCEAMPDNGKGELVVVEPARGTLKAIDTSAIGSGHLSYPFVFRDGETTYLMPEMAQIGPQVVVPIDRRDMTLGDPSPLSGLEDHRLIDPTIHYHKDRWWLFASLPRRNDLLFLWSSRNLLGPYQPHPDNPVVMDPASARPGGGILQTDRGLIRCGQDNRAAYGAGVALSLITELSEERYEERLLTVLQLKDATGPHTYFPMASGLAVVDYYHDAFAPLAWLHRLRRLF